MKGKQNNFTRDGLRRLFILSNVGEIMRRLLILLLFIGCAGNPSLTPNQDEVAKQTQLIKQLDEQAARIAASQKEIDLKLHEEK